MPKWSPFWKRLVSFESPCYVGFKYIKRHLGVALLEEIREDEPCQLTSSYELGIALTRSHGAVRKPSWARFTGLSEFYLRWCLLVSSCTGCKVSVDRSSLQKNSPYSGLVNGKLPLSNLSVFMPVSLSFLQEFHRCYVLQVFSCLFVLQSIALLSSALIFSKLHNRWVPMGPQCCSCLSTYWSIFLLNTVSYWCLLR